MQNKKNIFVLSFLIPLLWVISALSYSIDLNTQKRDSSSTFVTKQNHLNHTFQKSPLSSKKSDNVLDETELEFENEIDLFYDDLDFNLNRSYLFIKQTSNYAFSHFSLKHKVPLYDLFCNWKFHIV